jgi:hypothetical protein
MDRSNTKEKGPLGDLAVIRESLKVLDSIKPGMTAAEQVALLHRTVECLNMWYPIRSLGVKRMEEHFAAQIGKSFTRDAKAEYNGCQKTRAVRLVEDFRTYHIAIHSRNPNIYTSVVLFLTENCSILAMQSRHRVTDAIEFSDKAVIVPVADQFLKYLMTLDDSVCAQGNKTLVVNALKSLELTLYWIKDNAHKKASRIGFGENAVAMISCKLKDCLSVPQPAATASA